MFNSHDTHLHEQDYIEKVRKYLLHAYGKTIDEIGLSVHEIAKGLHDNLHPSEFVDKNASSWGIHRVGSSIPGTAQRILAL